ncbi:hypothetical protein TCAL_03049 [Tigriopus californicus]|uniref:EF-hand domain-containing protein n=1 Tax=Tigriopus californicus TaxID=6832 RepID=A0A553NTW2_TIGCA|nr:hypothetical protein TCAL_03049 [Tigriopus californicus]|eukprot:TCALIF_03049-PA protein Name:"Similar to cam1 Calmodulin (Schizosaccharomyces pombe (strain 972 / ATCC 24843))" AED:0.17 eAED:0.17 QI:194/0.75/0.8/1/0.5/0.6/5/100/88
MARYFKEQDIDEFRECFYLYARRGQINTMDELTVIMRSLGMSPTIAELRDYMKQKVDQIFKEANISRTGMVKYEEFIKIVCAPVPDYY